MGKSLETESLIPNLEKLQLVGTRKGCPQEQQSNRQSDQETGETDPESIDNLLRTGFRC